MIYSPSAGYPRRGSNMNFIERNVNWPFFVSWLCNFYRRYGGSDEEPVFSVTMLATPGAMRSTAAMILQF